MALALRAADVGPRRFARDRIVIVERPNMESNRGDERLNGPRASWPWAAAFFGIALAACTTTQASTTPDASNPGGDDSSPGDDATTDDGSSGSSFDGSDGSLIGPDASTADAPVADAPVADGAVTDSATDGGRCVAALHGSYVVRGDGKLLEETVNGLSGSETAVLNSTTGLPLTPILDVQDGNVHGCAAVAGNGGPSSGTAWCWRTAVNGNSSGQLGGGTTDTNGPVFHATQVLTAASQPLTGVVSVADGPSNSACAVTQDGKLYCWGDVTWALNGGATLSSPYALPVTTNGTTPLTHVLRAAVHNVFACAVVQGATANEVWCWGANNGNIQNLGTGDATSHPYPVKVIGPIDPTAVRIADVNGAYGTTCVLDGTNVRCWGGTGATGNVSSNGVDPALVEQQDGTTPLGNVVDLERGLGSFCTLNGDATIWCWGGNYKAYASKYISALDATLLGEAGGVGGSGQGGPRFETSDAMYHVGTGTRMVACGAL
jgi:hypothetical protein